MESFVRYLNLSDRVDVLSDMANRLIYCSIQSRLKRKIKKIESNLKSCFDVGGGIEDTRLLLLENAEDDLKEAEEWVETTTLYFSKSPPPSPLLVPQKKHASLTFAAQLIIQLTFSLWADYSEKVGKGYFLHLLFFQCSCGSISKPKSLFSRCEPRSCLTFHKCLKSVISVLLTRIRKVNVSIEKTDTNVMYHALKYLKCSKMFIKELLKNVRFEVEVLQEGKTISYNKENARIHYLKVAEDVSDLDWIPLCSEKCFPDCIAALKLNQRRRAFQAIDNRDADKRALLAKMETFLDPRRRAIVHQSTSD